MPLRCERCGKLEDVCDCPPVVEETHRVAPQSQTARISVENRKRGKTVTVVRGLSAGDNDLAALLSQLKAACGAGGAMKEDTLEIQGNHVDRLGEQLRGLGYRVKS